MVINVASNNATTPTPSSWPMQRWSNWKCWLMWPELIPAAPGNNPWP